MGIKFLVLCQSIGIKNNCFKQRNIDLLRDDGILHSRLISWDAGLIKDNVVFNLIQVPFCCTRRFINLPPL
jgi:hypothetical protein